jgi:polygalacturonase
MFSATLCQAQEYKASLFGCVSDGITNNTSSIQAAINFIAEKGGGKLSFYVGRYLTGGLELKSNVTIELHEGAVLVASANINDFIQFENERALLFGKNLTNVSIIGKGVIEGDPAQYFQITGTLKSKQLLQPGYLAHTPSLLTMVNCSNVKVEGIIFQRSLQYAQKYISCNHIDLNNQIIRNNAIENSGGIVFQNTKSVALKNIYIDANGRAIIKDRDSEITTVENCINPKGNPVL